MYTKDIYTINIVPQQYAINLDFLRLTKELPYFNRRFFEIIPQLQVAEQAFGYGVVPFRLSTMKGRAVGRVAYAQSDTHHLVEFRGAMAQQVYQHYLPVDAKCRRLDMAYTVWLPIHDDTAARRCFYAAEAYWQREGRTLGRKPPVLYRSAGGDTLYLGSRTSRRYLRIYNKWLQSGDEQYRNAWRFEIECKGDLAHIIWQRIQAGETIESIAMHEIQYMLKSWSIQLPDYEAYGLRTKVPTVKRNPQIDGKLAWLSKQVRPVVQKLIEMGYADEVQEALNIFADGTVTDVTVEE